MSEHQPYPPREINDSRLWGDVGHPSQPLELGPSRMAGRNGVGKGSIWGMGWGKDPSRGVELRGKLRWAEERKNLHGTPRRRKAGP